jgi:hypothetical protein
MKARILAQLAALSSLIDQDRKLTALDRARLESHLAQWGRDYTHAHSLMSQGLVITEEQRQAASQSGVDGVQRLMVVT